MKKVVPCFSEGRLESTSILFNSSINKCFGIIIVIEGTEDSLKVNSCFITPFFTTFSEQFRLVTYITMYVGIVEDSGKMHGCTKFTVPLIGYFPQQVVRTCDHVRASADRFRFML